MKVAVIGVGNMGKNHARVYSEMKGVELVGVCDSNEVAGKDVAKRFGTNYYSSYYSTPIWEADAVTIATPTSTHYGIAKDCLELGMDVLIEKPITTTIREAKSLINLARKEGRILQVGHIERFNPAIAYLANRIYKEDIVAIDARRLGPGSGRSTDVGVILDLMIHDIDLTLSLLGLPKKFKVYRDHPKEDYASAVLQFRHNKIATLTASRLTQMRERSFIVTTPNYCVVADCMNRQVSVHEKSSSSYINGGLISSDVVERPQIPPAEPLRLEIESFLHSCATREQPLVDGETGALALKTALDMLK